MNMINTSSENVPGLVLICRLCGNASDSYINIFGQDGIKQSVNEKILTHLKMEVLNSDLLPKIICHKCFHVLDEFHNFFLKSKKVQLLLKNTINESLFSIKIKIGLSRRETYNSSTNSCTKNDYKMYSFDDEKESTEIENCFLYKKESSPLNDKNEDDGSKEKIIESTATSDVFESDNTEYNNLLKINSINNDDSITYQGDQDLINIKQRTMENNFEKLIQQNDENTVSSSSSGFNSHIPIKLTENSCKLIYYSDDNSSMFQHCDLNTDKKVDLTINHSKSCMDNHHKKSTCESEDDLVDIPTSLSCILCRQVFMCAKELIKHYDQQHRSLIPTFKCSICGRMYKVLKEFYIHYEKHNSVKKYTCGVCGKSFTRNWTLRIHASVHSDAKPFNCNECSKTFKNLSSLKNHKKSHLPEECKLIHTCAFCGKSFKSKFILTTHERKHTGQNDFTCNICSKSFASKSSLLSHISIHNNNHEIHCPLCNKLMRTEKLLKRHLAVHSSKKKLKCEYCGKEFHYSTQLTEHIRLHTGELPYECEYCQKRFRLNSTLIIHRRQHTGLKPYKCKVCDHSFTNWPNYNKHMKRKHYNTIVKENNDELILLKI